MALLGVLGVIVLLYAAPISHYVTQSRTAAEHRAELVRAEAEHKRLQARVAHLSRADAVEQEARSLGMVRRGERAFVIEAPTR
jgi:cell division protein FtsB